MMCFLSGGDSLNDLCVNGLIIKKMVYFTLFTNYFNWTIFIRIIYIGIVKWIKWNCMGVARC